MREMEKVWHGIQFNPVMPTEVPFKTEFFRSPSRAVRLLRRLSRNGRGYLERTIRERQGRPKLVLGLPNDAQQVAPLVALAHGVHLAQNVYGSDSVAVDYTTATTRSAVSGDLKDVQGTVRASDVEVSDVVADASKQQTHAVEPTTGCNATPLVTLEGGDDFIPEKTLTHLEEMLEEDHRRIVEEQDNLSAVQSKRVRDKIFEGAVTRSPHDQRTGPTSARKRRTKSRRKTTHKTEASSTN
jgi:hypothetical protein